MVSLGLLIVWASDCVGISAFQVVRGFMKFVLSKMVIHFWNKKHCDFLKQTVSSTHFFDRTLRMEFELTKAQQETLKLLTKNSLRAAEEIKVLKEVIEAQHQEIEELKKDLRIQQLTTAEKEYQDIVRVHNQEKLIGITEHPNKKRKK